LLDSRYHGNMTACNFLWFWYCIVRHHFLHCLSTDSAQQRSAESAFASDQSIIICQREHRTAMLLVHPPHPYSLAF